MERRSAAEHGRRAGRGRHEDLAAARRSAPLDQPRDQRAHGCGFTRPGVAREEEGVAAHRHGTHFLLPLRQLDRARIGAVEAQTNAPGPLHRFDRRGTAGRAEAAARIALLPHHINAEARRVLRPLRRRVRRRPRIRRADRHCCRARRRRDRVRRTGGHERASERGPREGLLVPFDDVALLDEVRHAQARRQNRRLHRFDRRDRWWWRRAAAVDIDVLRRGRPPRDRWWRRARPHDRGRCHPSRCGRERERGRRLVRPPCPFRFVERIVALVFRTREALHQGLRLVPRLEDARMPALGNHIGFAFPLGHLNVLYSI